MRSWAMPILTITAALCLCQPVQSQVLQKNTTGLPTYPKDEGGVMDSEFRLTPDGKQCIHYASDTDDALVAVEAWYKKALPGATVGDVNKNSPYAPIVLNGIRLLAGKDVVNIYRLPKGDHTLIEIFKCK